MSSDERRAPPIAAPAPSATTPAAFHQQLGIDGSKFAMHGTVTSTTPPAAPAAVTDDMVRAYWNATNQLGHARGFRDIGDEIKPGAAEYIRVGIAAALAAAASAAPVKGQS